MKVATFNVNNIKKRLSNLLARLTYDLHGKAITYESFWHKPGYELFLTMRAFADDLPEQAAGLIDQAKR